MDKQLELVASSYDRAIELGRKGIDLYQELPEHLIQDPDFAVFQKARTEGLDSDSSGVELKDYLSPCTDMNFIDLGCCLNLMFKGYDSWPSIYYGVDISTHTIQLLQEFVARKKLSIGSLYCGSIHDTPFEDNCFDIGACIGVLEYFEKDYVEQAIQEMHRIIKPCGKIVLDIPNLESPMRRFMMLVEEHMGRADLFHVIPQDFEVIIEPYFEIEKKQPVDAVAMIQYFLRCKK